MTNGQIVAEVSGAVIFFTLVIMQWYKKLPSVDSIQELASVMNSRGGNIMVLGSFSVFFFFSALRFTYWFMEKSADGKLSPQDTLGLAAFTWITGTAFGGSFTSMVKAMTGENTKARSTDGNGNGNGHSTPVLAPVQAQPIQPVVQPVVADPAVNVQQPTVQG